MNDKEKNVGQTMADAISALPDDKKQYFIGFAEGVSATVALTRKDDHNA